MGSVGCSFHCIQQVIRMMHEETKETLAEEEESRGCVDVDDDDRQERLESSSTTCQSYPTFPLYRVSCLQSLLHKDGGTRDSEGESG